MIDIAIARRHLEEKHEARRLRLRKRFEEATHDCSRIVDAIASTFKPQRIYQWGSLLRPERFCENSDIDLAVEGITDAETYFALLGIAMRLTSFRLDIIQIEKIEPEFAESIRQSGRIVYERA